MKTDHVALEAGLRRGLGKAQIVMIGLGGAIGTGLFAGSSLAIGLAGPGVVLSYAIAGFIALTVTLSLSEMAVAHPAAGSFGVYAETYLNLWAGYIVRYTYWAAQAIATGGEAVAAGVYMTWWFPGTPIWLWSVGFCAVILLLNVRSVSTFGSAEYGFSLIKVCAIVLFIILGLAKIVGVGSAPIGLANLAHSSGGLLPHGLGGVWMAVIVGCFSFNGVEIIAVTSGETREPARAIPAALRSMVLRLFLFYVLSLAVIVTVAPWTDSAAHVVKESPFVRVFAAMGVPGAAGVMNFVVLSAALSSMNTNLYLSGRMAFSLARGGHAPAALGRLNRAGAPLTAVLLSGGLILAAAAISKLTPLAYNYLLGVALFGAMSVWMIILVSHIAFRRRRGDDLPVRTPLFPWLQFAALVLLAGVLGAMALSKDWRVAWLVGVPWMGVLTAAYLLRRRPQVMLPAN
ncbi:MAG: amino acid permease [Caulobacteraceae bacterium]|nr:amino acid permease [Caulobacteraceae bacterium]